MSIFTDVINSDTQIALEQIDGVSAALVDITKKQIEITISGDSVAVRAKVFALLAEKNIGIQPKFIFRSAETHHEVGSAQSMLDALPDALSVVSSSGESDGDISIIQGKSDSDSNAA